MVDELTVRVVVIQALHRHLSAGWTEGQLLSGRIATLNRREFVVALPRSATLLDLARIVEDDNGIAVEEQVPQQHDVVQFQDSL